jgi:hypothetical protein
MPWHSACRTWAIPGDCHRWTQRVITAQRHVAEAEVPSGTPTAWLASRDECSNIGPSSGRDGKSNLQAKVVVRKAPDHPGKETEFGQRLALVVDQKSCIAGDASPVARLCCCCCCCCCFEGEAVAAVCDVAALAPAWPGRCFSLGYAEFAPFAVTLE